MSKRKINLFFAIITFFTLALTACSNNNSATKKRPGKLRKPKALSLQLTAKLKILRKRFIGPTQLTISLPLKALMNKLLITKIKLNLL